MHPTRHHTEYAPPVLRAPSPASSIGTTYGEDQTSFSDSEEQLSQECFEKKVEERLELGLPSEEEESANRDPLLPRSPEGSPEEKELFEQVVESLRGAVQTLEENELFEQTLLRASQVGLEQQPAVADIDALMRGMMVVPQSSNVPVSDGASGSQPLDQNQNIVGSHNLINGHEHRSEGGPTGLVPGKRSRNGTRRN